MFLLLMSCFHFHTPLCVAMYHSFRGDVLYGEIFIKPIIKTLTWITKKKRKKKRGYQHRYRFHIITKISDLSMAQWNLFNKRTIQHTTFFLFLNINFH